jgi:hypothetical protein
MEINSKQYTQKFQKNKDISNVIMSIYSVSLSLSLPALRRQQHDSGLFKASLYAGYPLLMIPDLGNLSNLGHLGNLGNPYLSPGVLSPGSRTVSQSHARRNMHHMLPLCYCSYNFCK